MFGLLLDKGGVRTKDNEITVAPARAAYIPDKKMEKILQDI